MAEESMKDFEKEIEESFKNRKQYDDPDAGKWEVFQKMLDEKTVSRVKIIEVVKAGCVAYLDDVRGFIPASQLSLNYVEDLDAYQNKNIDVVVITADAEKKRLVLSHRQIEADEKQAEKDKRSSEIKVGDVLTGKVESIKDYGAFIDLGEGVSGLLHVSQISNTRVKHPGAVLKVGDEVQVKVTANAEGKISLSKRVLEEDNTVNDDPSEGFNYEEKGVASTSLASLLKGIKLD